MSDRLFFSGDWEVVDIDDNVLYQAAFEAVRFESGWNGFITPVVNEKVMDAIVARQAWLRAAGENVNALTWDGNGVMVHDEDDPDNPSFLLPDDEGLFDLSVLGICWQQVHLNETLVTVYNS